MTHSVQPRPLRDLWIATANPKKRDELTRLLAPLGIRVHTMSEAPTEINIVEDQDSFAGNAEKKAVTLARAVGAHAIGDDSGLCVDALDGRPGVHSARYAGPDASDQDRIDRLLTELGDSAEEARNAHFVCHVCLADPDGKVLASFEQICHGQILNQAQGEGGFGYDPIFMPAQSDQSRSFAEMSAAEKDALSHRGKALGLLTTHLAGLCATNHQ